MLWRLRQFLTLWWHSFASGESKRGKVKKVIALLTFFGLLPATLWQFQMFVYLHSPSEASLVHFRLAWLAGAVAVIAWLLFTAGRAYENAGVPELTVENELVF